MIRIVPETGSTNADLLAALRGGERHAEGDWRVARRRPRAGDVRAANGSTARAISWVTVVHRRAGDPSAATLSLVTGLALHEAVGWHLPGEADLRLKWPNDLLAGDAKLAGILLESQGDAVVIGIGVNLVSAPDLPDRKAIALSDLGTAPALDVFAEDLARSFAEELARWRASGLAAVVRRWRKLAHREGEPLEIREPGGGILNGEYAGVTDGGALRLRLADGTIHVIHAGEVLPAAAGAAQG